MNEFNELVKGKADKELLKMVYEFDLWSPGMLKAVEMELSRRAILPADLSSKRHRLMEIEDAELSKGKEASSLGLIVGWITVLGFIGLYIGYRYRFSTVASKYTTKKYLRYNKESRTYGGYLFYAALSTFILSILYTIAKIFGPSF